MELTMVYLSSCFCLLLLLFLIKLFSKLWWIPIHIQRVMASQGIKGPSYQFVYGNTKEIIKMRIEVMSSPMELSHDIFPRILPRVYSWIKLYGMNFLNWHGSQAQLVVTDPLLIKEILNNKDGKYPKTQSNSYLKKLTGDGLVASRGKKWYKMRKVANHAFHSEGLKNMIPAMIGSVEMMVERWRHHEGKEIEVFQEFKVLTSEVISSTAFGSNYLEGENIFNMLTRIAVIISRNNYKIKIPLIGMFMKTADDVESDILEQGIRDSILKIIKKREERVIMGDLDGYGNDFLGLLLKAYHAPDKNKTITIDDIVDECKVFYAAGQETTTSLLTWTVLLLAIYSDWQEKLRTEVLELLGQQIPTPDNIAKLKIMSMVINESLRLYSPVGRVTRKIDREVRLGELSLPANMEIMIPVLALHYNPGIWGEDVHLFNPERFEEGITKATNDKPSAFLPFGLGPRTCVGLNFATTETKIALSMILQRYKFSLSPNYVHSPIQLLTTIPQHGLQVMLESL